jgi:hypothetical protein
MDITIKAGKRIRTFGGWYQHNYVVREARELFGYIQVRRRNGRTETITCFPHTSSAVLGHDVPWLIWQNQIYAAELAAQR